MKITIVCHSLLTILAGLVISEDYMLDFATEEYSPIQTIPTGIRILYFCSLFYHSTAFINIFKLETPDKYLWLLTVCCLCWFEEFFIPFLFIGFFTFIYIVAHVKHLNVMDIHHIVTVYLIMLSWQYHLNIIGSLVMLLNDITDVPMTVLRVLHKQGVKKEFVHLFNMAKLFLACVVWIMWMVYRIFFLGYIIYKSSLFYANHSDLKPDENVAFTSLLISLSILFIFNLVWILQLSRKMLQIDIFHQ
jgi:hypothetical protein